MPQDNPSPIEQDDSLLQAIQRPIGSVFYNGADSPVAESAAVAVVASLSMAGYIIIKVTEPVRRSREQAQRQWAKEWLMRMAFPPHKAARMVLENKSKRGRAAMGVAHFALSLLEKYQDKVGRDERLGYDYDL